MALPRMRFIKLYGEGLDTVEPYDVVFAEIGDTPVTLEQIMALTGSWLRWRCFMEGCHHSIPLRLWELDVGPHRIVQHLLADHHLTADQVLEIAPHLDIVVREVADHLARQPPVESRTGGPTKMGTTEVRT